VSRLAAIVIHCRDPYIAGPFWSLALGVPAVEDDLAKLATRTLAAGEAILLRDPTGRTPDVWISPHAEVGPGATHLDLHLDDMADLERLVRAGAVVRWEVAGAWTVLEAPDGILFCARHPA
jgi:hypothetical protein